VWRLSEEDQVGVEGENMEVGSRGKRTAGWSRVVQEGRRGWLARAEAKEYRSE
jgi:hypothetical protein